MKYKVLVFGIEEYVGLTLAAALYYAQRIRDVRLLALESVRIVSE